MRECCANARDSHAKQRRDKNWRSRRTTNSTREMLVVVGTRRPNDLQINTFRMRREETSRARSGAGMRFLILWKGFSCGPRFIVRFISRYSTVRLFSYKTEPKASLNLWVPFRMVWDKTAAHAWSYSAFFDFDAATGGCFNFCFISYTS